MLGLVAGCGGSAAPSGTPISSASPGALPTPSPAPVTPTPAPSIPAGPVSDPSTWPLAWSDEFDGPAGAGPDPETWGRDLGDGSAVGLVGWGNNERQTYTDSPANAALDGKGHLVISVLGADGTLGCYYGPCEYTSARLLTKGRLEVQYGRIEARIKVPGGFGLWPAFWMLGADIDQVPWPACGEIDIMEFVGRWPTAITGTIHGPGYSGSSGPTSSVDLGGPVADAYHTFAIEWRPDRITWLLDGTPYNEATPAEVAPNAWVFDAPFFLVLNVAVGGNLGGMVDPEMPFPQTMKVDYVRLYQESAP